MVEPLACVVRGVEESWIGRGQSVAVIGTGPIGLMFVRPGPHARRPRDRGRPPPARLDKALEMGARGGRRRTGRATSAELLRQRSPDGRGPTS